MPQSRRSLVPQARALYAQGLSISDVAGSLGVSASTVSRWRVADKDWDALRAQQRKRRDPRALLAILETQRDDLARDYELAPGAKADALYKLQRVIGQVRKEFKDVSTALAVVGDLAAWARQVLSDDDLTVVARAIESFLDHLKSEAQG